MEFNAFVLLGIKESGVFVKLYVLLFPPGVEFNVYAIRVIQKLIIDALSNVLQMHI
jgi:hypothetical protein